MRSTLALYLARLVGRLLAKGSGHQVRITLEVFDGPGMYDPATISRWFRP